MCMRSKCILNSTGARCTSTKYTSILRNNLRLLWIKAISDSQKTEKARVYKVYGENNETRRIHEFSQLLAEFIIRT